MKRPFRPILLLGIPALVCVVTSFYFVAPVVSMPGHSYNGVLPPLTAAQEDSKKRMMEDLRFLAEEIGERNDSKPGTLEKSADYIAEKLTAVTAGSVPIERQHFKWSDHDYQNISLELKGDTKPEEIIVIGAHYDTVSDCAGADDNGSGTVAVLELARLFAHVPHNRTLRFVAFANEEFYFRTHGMGSYQYAERCHNRGEKIVAMLALETIGYFRDEKGSQKYPPIIGWFYPKQGDFITFVGNTKNRPLVNRLIRVFREEAKFPSQGIAAPQAVSGVDWSDHLYFWHFGYPGVMITDTAPYRNPHYHQTTDRLQTIDFDKMTRVVSGLVPCITDLAN